MPPFNKRRLPEDIRRWRRSLRTAVTPLMTRDDFEDESDENCSPVSRKSDMPFTFERKRSHDDDDDDDEASSHKGRSNGTSRDMENSSITGQPVGSNLEPESDSDSESDVESEIESDLNSNCSSNAPLPPPPPTTTARIAPPSTTTATIAKTFTPLPPASTTTAAPLTLVPNTPTPKQTSTASTTQQPSDLFVPVVEPTIGFPTTSSIITTLTTTPLSEVTTQPRKGLDDPVTTTDTVWITALPFMQSSLAPSSTDLNFPPIYTVLPDTDPTRDQGDDDHHDKDKNKFPPPGLDPTAEHLLIAAGAIGAFILVCFVGWIVYRTMKKSKASPSGGNNLAAMFPWKRKDGMGGSWANGGVYRRNEPPPMYDEGDVNSMQGAGYYGAGKVYAQGPGSVARSATGTLPRQEQDLESGSALASIIDQYPQGNGEMMNRNEPGQTMGTPMQGSSFYSQTDPTLQASDSYDPASRRAYRASEISSISSGFGDGEMILPQPMAPASNTIDTTITTTTAAAAAAVANDNTNINTTTTIPTTTSSPIVQPPPPVPTSNNAAGRFSWMSRRDERRETVYTQTSEDRPTRFRSVASWVNQQTGRIRRADSRARERGEVPVMPAIPGGQINATQQTAYR